MKIGPKLSILQTSESDPKGRLTCCISGVGSFNAYALNNITTKKDPNGSVTVRFGGCEGKLPTDCLL